MLYDSEMDIPLWIFLFMPYVMDVNGHGRLVIPPSRGSMWRYGYDNPPNYDDNQLFCGGFSVSTFLSYSWSL